MTPADRTFVDLARDYYESSSLNIRPWVRLSETRQGAFVRVIAHLATPPEERKSGGVQRTLHAEAWRLEQAIAREMAA